MPQLNAFGIVVRDMAETSRFYRLLDVHLPETPGEGHVETALPNGVRPMLDAEEVVRSFRPEWTRETGYARVVDAGFESEKQPWDAFWGRRDAQLRDPNGVPVDLFAWTR